jgi:hypothetical protein
MPKKVEVGIGKPQWMPVVARLALGLAFLAFAAYSFSENAKHNQHLRRIGSSGILVTGKVEGGSLFLKDSAFDRATLRVAFVDRAGTAAEVPNLPVSYRILVRLNAEALVWEKSPHPRNPFQIDFDEFDSLKGTPAESIPHRYLKHSSIDLTYDPEDSSFARIVGDVENENTEVGLGTSPFPMIAISGVVGLLVVFSACFGALQFFRDKAARRAWLAGFR